MGSVSAADIGARIVAVASRFVGLYETKQNAQWDDPDTPGPDQQASDLIAVLQKGGWEPGWPYCASFARGCWLTAYEESGAPAAFLDGLRKRLSPSVMQTFENNRAEVIQTPQLGAILLLQKGMTAFGHAGLVTTLPSGDGVLGGQRIKTIEGNTSNPGTGSDDDHHQREGDGVFRRERVIDFRRQSGLWLRGFLNPPAV